MTSSKKLVLATSNQGKYGEFLQLFASNTGEQIQLLSLKEFANYPDPIEDAPSFIGNALIKAYAAASHTGGAAIADDSGLCVAALQDAPGIYSARFAQLNNFTAAGISKDEVNYSCLLEKLQDFPAPEQRQAYFYCCLVLVRFPNDPAPIIAVGKCHGEILQAPQSKGHGHGYDPVFFYPALGASFAEIEMTEKNAISHRAIAFKNLLENADFKAWLES